MRPHVVPIQLAALVLLLVAVVFDAVHDWEGPRAGTYYVVGLVMSAIAVTVPSWTTERVR